MTPYQRLEKALHLAKHIDSDYVEHVKTKDLEVALKFLKWHRRWRLYDGHVFARKIEPEAKLAKKIDRLRVKYYSKLFGVNIKDIVERVTKFMRDAMHGGGNLEDPASIIEAYLHPEKFSAKRKAATKSKDRKRRGASRRVRTRSHRHRSSS